ncbi:MAG: glycine--tRNA ligase subunit beta [Cyanophyceae cyanobacterium]
MSAFLLEIGTEELPASFVSSALEQWRQRIPTDLQEADLHYDRIQFFGTPRRLAVLIDNLPEQQPDRVDEIKGPPAQIGFVDGDPAKGLSKAAQGFARKQGVDPDDLELRQTDKGDFLYAIQQIAGQPTATVVSELGLGWITGLTGERLMRWGSGDLKFPRPIRWLVAMLDQQVLPLELEGIPAGASSLAHRVLHPEPVVFQHASEYAARLQAACVQVDPARRQAKIREGVTFIAQRAGGEAQIPDSLLEEVTQLVEWPTVVMGQFEPEFLILPAPVIKTVMISHQRYFPVHQPGKPRELLPHFITISNGDPAKSDIIAAGNSRVIRARLADARFFYDEDRRRPLERLVPRLDAVTFADGLGSLGDKVRRIEQIAEVIGGQLHLPGHIQLLVQETAHLAKADLVSQMVYEFPELQGVMGADYARQGKKPAAVADGIEQHYWPLGSGAALPTVISGQVVGLADRLDTLVGLFRLGKKPTGSSDPFALRRAANALLLICWQSDFRLDWVELIGQALAIGAPTVTGGDTDAVVLPKLKEFLGQRLMTLLEEEGIEADLIAAVVDGDYLQDKALRDPVAARHKAQFLQTLRQTDRLPGIYPTLNRLARISRQSDLSHDQRDPALVVDPRLFEGKSEQDLFEAAQKLAATVKEGLTEQARSLDSLIKAFEQIAPTITTFFEDVLVMAEDPEVKKNRLNLLATLHHNALLLGDFSQILMA